MANSAVASDLSVLYQRAWYGGPIEQFVDGQPDSIVGRLAIGNEFDLTEEQRNAWLAQIALMQSQLRGLGGTILLEYSIPRMGRRIDVVLIVGSVVFVVEFKVGEKTFDRKAIEQVWDYALDLKNFHRASHEVPIVPVLVATDATSSARDFYRDPDDVYRPLAIAGTALRQTVDAALVQVLGPCIDGATWARSPYHPTPTIIEAARALYANHSVDEIARSDAGAKNLHSTSSRIHALVEKARTNKQKLICLVTGVPGAGKTLVGLNIATQRRDENEISHAVFLSGNAPLVAVLREALTRDEVERRRRRGEMAKKGRVGESVKAFIQNVHHFRDEALLTKEPPAERVVIFDEAQRAWNLRQTAVFMQRKKNKPGFDKSEPEFLISYMDRHSDWAVVICLVGGGQEINTGEAGIAAWLEAVLQSFPEWHVYISDRLVDAEYEAGEALSLLDARGNVNREPDLHLAVSMRSFRAEHVSALVKAILDCEKALARQRLTEISGRYPICVTRDLSRAKEWVRSKARGSERFGLVASSKAQRLKPHAVDIRVSVDPVHYFLDDRSDTRSSFYLEDAATEFQVQGLELDWACVTWDGDLRYANGEWTYHDFRGSRWMTIANADNRNYLRNAYRVLLTRARQGMVIFAPPGDPKDPTRGADLYDPTFNYLAELGIPVLDTLAQRG